MRPILLLGLLLLVPFSAWAQAVASNVYSWHQAPLVKRVGYEQRTLLTGTTRDFSNLTVLGITLFASHPPQPVEQLDEEALLVVRSGELTLTLNQKRKSLGPGSVVLIMPSDEYRLENKTTQPLTYYLIRYTSNEMPDLDLYRLAGGSFWVDWQQVPYVPHNEGGIRRLLNGGTVMNKRLEVHATTLSAGLWSHEPHTHRASEILIVMTNTAQEQIEGSLYPAEVGDVIFLESEVSHSIQNTGQDPCTYLAFQFE